MGEITTIGFPITDETAQGTHSCTWERIVIAFLIAIVISHLVVGLSCFCCGRSVRKPETPNPTTPVHSFRALSSPPRATNRSGFPVNLL